MYIIVDADACPVKDIIVKSAKQRNIKVTMVMDFSHVYDDGYSKVITVDQGFDSADFKISGITKKGDLVVTQDLGLASIIIGKGAYCLHVNGFFINNENIDKLLFERHLNKESRKINKKGSHIKKRTASDNENFKNALEQFLNEKAN